MPNFPTGPDNIVENVTGQTPQSGIHSQLHNQLADSVNAIQHELLPGGTMNLAAHVAAADPHTQYLTQTEGDALYAPRAGGGYLTQTQADTRYLQLSGGTLTGSLLLAADPTQALQAATKQYADTKLTQGQADVLYAPAGTGMSQAQADARYLQLSGGTLTGPLVFSPGAQIAASLGGNLLFSTNGVTRWFVDFTAGGFLANTDNTVDIGAAAANRPRNVNVGTSVSAPAVDTLNVGPTTNNVLNLRANNLSRWQVSSSALLPVSDNTYDLGGNLGSRVKNVNLAGYLQELEVVTPGTPGAGNVRIYPKADHHVYALDSTGVEWDLSLVGLTQTAADARYAQLSTSDPYPQYLTQAEGDARYALTGGGAANGLPPGGTAGQVLSKIDGTNYNTQWITPSGGGGGLTLPLGQALTFAPDNTYDIGAASSARPRNLYVASSAVIAGNLTAGSMTVGGTLNVNGGPSTFMFGASMSSGAWTGNGSVPPGGASGQVLSKSAAGDYALAWTTPATGVTWPLLAPNGTAAAPSYSFAAATATGMFSNSGILTLTAASTINIQAAATFNIQFWTGGSNRWRIDSTGILAASSDNLYDIGASGASRPRDFYLGRNEFIGGNSQITGTVGIGTAPVTYSGLIFQPTMAGANQFALYAPLTFSTTGTGNTFVFYTLPTYAASTRTVASGASFYADTPTLGAGVTVTTMSGLFVGNQGRSGVTNAYGVYINPISGASSNNVAIFTNGPANVFGGRTNLGGTGPGDNHYFIIMGTTPASTSLMPTGDQTGVRLEYWSNSACTGAVVGFFAAVLGGAGVQTVNATAIQAGNPGNQGGGIQNSYGIKIDSVTSGINNNYGLWIDRPSGASGDNKAIVFGNSNEYIRNPKNGANNLSIESSDGYLMLSSVNGTHVNTNAYWDGSNWQRFNVGASSFYCTTAGGFQLYGTASGSNPIAGWTPLMTVDPAGTLTLAGNINANGYLTVGASATASIYLPDSNNYIVVSSGYLYLRFGNGVVVQTTTGVAAPISCGTLTTSGDVTVGNNLNVNFNTIFLFSDHTRRFLASGPTIDYGCGPAGNHTFTFTAGGAAPCVAASFTPTSARKLKTDIRPFDNPLSLVEDERLHAVRYTDRGTGDARIGFVADDWLPVLPEVVALDDIGDVMALDYDRISAVTFEALKQYAARTDARLAALEKAA